MRCPACGSSLWNNDKCPACGRLASDTSRRQGSHPEPTVAARHAALKGAFGGLVAGYLGGGPLELDKLGNQMLVAAGIGAVVGIAFAAWLSLGSGNRDRVFWLYVPAIAFGAAVLVGVNEVFDWALGWALAPHVKGLVAAGLGAVIGAVSAAGLAYIAARYRDRAYNEELKRLDEAREPGQIGSV
jgi:hypothetical protein